jgi:hypothetical protein
MGELVLYAFKASLFLFMKDLLLFYSVVEQIRLFGNLLSSTDASFCETKYGND